MEKTTKVKMTPEEAGMIEKMIDQTWQYVGNDFEEMCGGSCSKAEMCEAVLDAGRMNDFASTDAEKEALRKFRTLSYEQQCRFAKKVL